MALTMFVNADRGVDGSGTPGVDWVGNPGQDYTRPRRTVDAAAGAQAGMRILFADGVRYPLTGVYQRVNGTIVTNATIGLYFEIGTASTLEKDRVFIGRYGNGPRPILDGMGTIPVGVQISQGTTIEDLHITNFLQNGIQIGTDQANCRIRRNLITGQRNNQNDGNAIYVRGPNCLIEWNILDDNGADNIVSDYDGATGLIVRDNFVLNVGARSMDGADGIVFNQYSSATEIRRNLISKVSRQKQHIFLEKKGGASIPATGPIVEANALLGPCDGSGACSLISVKGAVVRRNFFASPRFVGMDRSNGSERYPEGTDVYSNIMVGIPMIARPDGSGTVDIDSAGYANGAAMTGAFNATAHVVNLLRHNFIYNVPNAVLTQLAAGKNEAHNNVIVRTKNEALPAADGPSTSGNLLYDEGSTVQGADTGSPVSNIFHDSARPFANTTRIPGSRPPLVPGYGIGIDAPGYWSGNGLKVAPSDWLGTTFTTENAGAGCNIGPLQVVAG